MKLNGKVAWVVGASSGIGAAVARELASRGGTVVRVLRAGVDGGLAGSGDLAGAAAGPAGRAAEYSRLDYCGAWLGRRTDDPGSGRRHLHRGGHRGHHPAWHSPCRATAEARPEANLPNEVLHRLRRQSRRSPCQRGRAAARERGRAWYAGPLPRASSAATARSATAASLVHQAGSSRSCRSWPRDGRACRELIVPELP